MLAANLSAMGSLDVDSESVSRYPRATGRGPHDTMRRDRRKAQGQSWWKTLVLKLNPAKVLFKKGEEVCCTGGGYGQRPIPTRRFWKDRRHNIGYILVLFDYMKVKGHIL